MGKRSRILSVLMSVMCAASLLGACGSASSGTSAESTGSAKKNGYEQTESDVTVTLTTDKTEYNDGDTVNYTLTIKNDRSGWSTMAKQFAYSNDGLVPASEDSMPDMLPAIEPGDTYTLEGKLRGGTPDSSLAGSGTDKSGSEYVTIRPYVKVTYGGKEAMIRCILNFKMVQKVQQFGDKAKKEKQASVHDPSIFKDRDGKYYILGTHITSAESDDLFDWTQTDDRFRAGFSQETIDQVRAWNKDENAGSWYDYLWAPDVVYNEKMQKYCVYLSADGDDWKSNIVLLTGDSIYGPYEYAGTVVYGGFDADNWTETDAQKVLGGDSLPDRYTQYGVKNKQWGTMFPNCIDPCVFYDEDGKLWMSYGSWSGGIFMLQLDTETGLRDYSVTYPTQTHSDSYFGTLIAGGQYVSGEGSYIQHIGDYYYLFMSYGNLEAKGGYNIRVFRSNRPDGDYVDELGNTPYYDTYQFNYNLNIGERLFGGYKWRSMSVGQVAQGHNSAFVDDDGKAYIVYHTRTTNGTEGHYVRIHQLFVNKDGWLVAAPYETDGETLDENGLDTSEITGKYDLIMHKLEIDYANYEVNNTQSIELKDDGTISGDYKGTWSVQSGSPYIDITLDGDTYTGVVYKENIEGSSVETTVFTVLGQKNQINVWGSHEVEE